MNYRTTQRNVRRRRNSINIRGDLRRSLRPTLKTQVVCLPDLDV